MSSRDDGWSFGRALQYDPAELEQRLEREGRVTLAVTADTALVLAKDRGDDSGAPPRYWGEVWHRGSRAGTINGASVNELMRRATGELARIEQEARVPSPAAPPDPPRRHIASNGQIYVVYISPLERSTGVDPRARAVVFVRESDGAVTSARVAADVDPRWLSGSDLDDLLQRAR